MLYTDPQDRPTLAHAPKSLSASHFQYATIFDTLTIQHHSTHRGISTDIICVYLGHILAEIHSIMYTGTHSQNKFNARPDHNIIHQCIQVSSFTLTHTHTSENKHRYYYLGINDSLIRTNTHTTFSSTHIKISITQKITHSTIKIIVKHKHYILAHISITNNITIHQNFLPHRHICTHNTHYTYIQTHTTHRTQQQFHKEIVPFYSTTNQLHYILCTTGYLATPFHVMPFSVYPFMTIIHSQYANHMRTDKHA